MPVLRDQVLNVRWANDDPNPAVKIRKERAEQDRGAEAILNKWGSTALWEYTMPTPLSYPTTDAQYAAVEGATAEAGAEQQAYDPAQLAAWQAYYASMAAGSSDGAADATTATTDQPASDSTAAPAASGAHDEPKKRAADSAAAPAAGESSLTRNIAQMINATVKKQRTEKKAAPTPTSTPAPAAAPAAASSTKAGLVDYE